MKIKTWIKYEESFIPPRCRKPRYNLREEYVDANLREASHSELSPAFMDNSYNGKGLIFAYKGKLWTKTRVRDPELWAEREIKTALDQLVHVQKTCSCYLRSSFDRVYKGMDTSRKAVMAEVRKDMRRYLLVDGTLYEETPEPHYCIYTFGLGHNHGGTALSVDYHYNPNISRRRYFSALQGAEAVSEAKRIAIGRGDTESIPRFKPEIEVYMPELVKVKPRKQHGDGNPLLATMEQIISASPDSTTAGLLCLAETLPKY